MLDRDAAPPVRTLTSEAIVVAAATTYEALTRDFGIDKPRLAIAALRLVVRSGAQTGHQVFVGFGERLPQAPYTREVF